MLTPLDDSPWHQLPTTFDHVGTSDPRFFDRLWFSATDRAGKGTLQFTLGVYQNMNVVDGGFVTILDGRQHNLRVSRPLRPRYRTEVGALRVDVVEPMRHLHLTVGPNPGPVRAELEWVGEGEPQEERHHFARQRGRVLEDYSRYDQIGVVSGWLEVEGRRRTVDSWWACRDHSWGVRERVGIPEPHTGEEAARGGSLFAFLFFSTGTHLGHVQVSGGPDRAGHMTAELLDRATGRATPAQRVHIDAGFHDPGRPRRFSDAVVTVHGADGSSTELRLGPLGPAVAMTGLGYGGYDDGLGLGVYRGDGHVETDVWDVTDPAVVRYPDGRADRPVHRIQPVHVAQTGPAGRAEGTGSLTFIAEVELDADGRLRVVRG